MCRIMPMRGTRQPVSSVAKEMMCITLVVEEIYLTPRTQRRREDTLEKFFPGSEDCAELVFFVGLHVDKRRPHWTTIQPNHVHHRFHRRHFVTSPASAQRVERDYTTVQQLGERFRITSFRELMELQGQSRRDSRDARSKSAHTDAEVSCNHIVAGTAGPVQTIANVINEHLQATNVALAVCPTHERRNRSQTLHHRRAKVRPVATVNEHAEPRCFTDRTVILK